MKVTFVTVIAILVLGLALVPAAGANHLGADGGCSISRPTMVAGGAIPGVGNPGGPFSQCHNQVYCLLQRECLFEITLKVTGIGLVDGRLFPYDGAPDQLCPLTPGECVLTYASAKPFDLHFDCGVGRQVTAINVVVSCTAHWAE